ncbi:TcpQ domain-containing protein [Alishewanella sp. BS5-314]|jgi:hypothetical protein|uniref:toxin co-regulated pilus biosynthesis Q family protein n=1 Tax=Alishewanella sp. BS5-314 TaxID=2755587 RepID=UPI0021BBA934|nr:toxin co-regulated pilus biosynthesis Q family protein [Alishewanella sp. BS5-314]MCT8124774.1 TcpQ domain-containing protein [Alishewanella sp. BS5-314]
MKVFVNVILLLLGIVLIYFLVIKPDVLINPEKTNTAAEGFSRFYANFRNSIMQGSSKSEYIITLQDSSKDLIPQLRRRELQVTAADPAWRGANTRRRFQAGETVKQALGQYAQQENLVLFWTLPRDYVIKQFFETNGTLLDTVQELAFTISPDFKQRVTGWYCPRARALVMTDLEHEYLRQSCIATAQSLPARR